VIPCSPVGFVGIGVIGSRIVRRLLDNGRSVIVYDVNHEAVAKASALGAGTAETLMSLAQQCDVVLLSLPTSRAVREVVEGTEGLLRSGKPLLIADLSTNSPTECQRLSYICAATGGTFIDCPLTGGIVGAEKGTFTAMVGAGLQGLARLLPVLEIFCTRIVHVGPAGHGAAAKLIHNMLGEIQVHSMAEALCLAAKVGLDVPRVCDVLANGMATSRVFTELYARAGLKRRFLPPIASVSQARKDQELLTEMADAAGVELSLTPTVMRNLQQLCEMGLGAHDVTSVLLLYEQALQVECPEVDLASSPAHGGAPGSR